MFFFIVLAPGLGLTDQVLFMSTPVSLHQCLTPCMLMHTGMHDVHLKGRLSVMVSQVAIGKSINWLDTICVF